MATRWADRLASVRLYLITDASPRVPLEQLLEAAIGAGVGMVQLREKSLPDSALLEAASKCAFHCSRLGVPFIVNDRVDIALAVCADGVHVGQNDLPVATVRSLLGGDGPDSDVIVGLSTHTRAEIDAAGEADYIGVGPIHETPTKPGRPAVGAELVRYAAERSAVPFFAIGGLDPTNVGEVIRAGASGVSVLRWVTRSDDPARATREMREAIDAAGRDLIPK
jgi:thiamine-phosphate pyrophosphorylase